MNVTGRKQVVDINGSLSDERNITCSVLQGSILGPILFICFINDFPRSTILKAFMFADDTTCLISGKNLNDIVNVLNTEIQSMALWYKSNKMAVNTSKTKYIIFHSKGKKVDKYPDIIYNNNERGKFDINLMTKIERVSTSNVDSSLRFYKLLGIYFDENLNFNKHIEDTCAKLSKSLFLLRRSQNFISKKALTSLYHALFHPHLLYCINITGCANSTNLTKISLLQKKAIRIISHAKSRDHTEPLFLALNILPFHKLLIQAKLTFMHKIFYDNAHISFTHTWTKNSERHL